MDHAPGGALSAGISRSSQTAQFPGGLPDPGTRRGSFPAALPHPGRGRGHRILGHSDFGRRDGLAVRTHGQWARHSTRRFEPPRRCSELSMFDPEKETGFLMEAIRMLNRELGPDVPVLGFAAAPWTLACYMIRGAQQGWFPRRENDAVLRSGNIPVVAGPHCESYGLVPARADCGGRERRATF